MQAVPPGWKPTENPPAKLPGPTRPATRNTCTLYLSSDDEPSAEAKGIMPVLTQAASTAQCLRNNTMLGLLSVSPRLLPAKLKLQTRVSSSLARLGSPLKLLRSLSTRSLFRVFQRSSSISTLYHLHISVMCSHLATLVPRDGSLGSGWPAFNYF